MSYHTILHFPVNYVTARDVLALKGLRRDMPNVVLRHDYDYTRNWYPVLKAEQEHGVVSSNYLLMNKQILPIKECIRYEKRGFEFGLHLNYMESQSYRKEIAAFKALGLQLTTMTPHGWAKPNGEYPMFGNFEADRDFILGKDGCVYSMKRFYDFCHEHFGSYDTTYDVARYHSLSGESFLEIPYRGVMLIDDSGGWRKPYTEDNVLEHMDDGKVYVFLVHPSNLNWLLEFGVYYRKSSLSIKGATWNENT